LVQSKQFLTSFGTKYKVFGSFGTKFEVFPPMAGWFGIWFVAGGMG